MRFNLKVPFAEKDAAKQLGARGDAASKLWYVEGKADMAPFAKWSATPRDGSAPSSSTPARVPVKAKAQGASEGIVQIGSRYVELPRVCECLPWDVCDKCRATALSA
ncbi:DUF5710 domain-containing protein [Uliginosibacterium sp. H3]|uniref:DUF5710 domain-containing protein n=1 Tax=Uliginosibacterium silvisoli TaxID=3114758 RepID=A0ABU6K420_9RHOO|nr:DUF5710 domain-containing protein [Uliginosibacterium sp. H3]